MAPMCRREGSDANASQRNSGKPEHDNGSSKYTSGLHLFRKEFHQKKKGKAQQGRAKDKYRNGEINEAWRSLPGEVKETYNQEAKNERKQFQEVHGNRKKFQAAFQTKCSPKYFQLGLANLSDSQREEVKSMGFESLLKMTCGTLAREVCFELVNLFDPCTRCLNIQGTSITITAEDVGSILGIPASGREVPVRGLKVQDLKQSFGKLEFKEYPKLFSNGAAKGLYFKRAFLLFAFGVLLCPSTKTRPSTKHLHAVVDVVNALEYNWGKFVLDWLVGGVKSLKPSLGGNTKLKTKPPKWFGGCLYFLMIFYFQKFPLNPHYLVSNTNAIEYWTNENIYYRVKYEKEAKNNHSEEAEPSDYRESISSEDGSFEQQDSMTQHKEAATVDEIVEEFPVIETLWDYSFVTNTTQGGSSNSYRESAVEEPTPSPIDTDSFFDDLAREEDWLLETPTQEGQVNEETPLEGSMDSIVGEGDESFFDDLSVEYGRFFNNSTQEGQVGEETTMETSTPQSHVDHSLLSNAGEGASQVVPGSRTVMAAGPSPVDIDCFLDNLARENGMVLGNLLHGTFPEEDLHFGSDNLTQ